MSVLDVQEILAIDLDGDQEKALAFVREKLAKHVKKARNPIVYRFSRPVTARLRRTVFFAD